MGVRMPGMGSGMIPPDMVEKLIQVQKRPIELAQEKKAVVNSEKEEYSKLTGFINDLDTALTSIKTRADFYKMKVESSHPDIMDGTVSQSAMPGSYEFEVRGMATAEKELAYGLPDKDKTKVGFGYLLVHREDEEPFEVVVDPGSTLQDVANKINDAGAGVKAMIVNTKYKPEGFRLLVISEKSGKESKITMDEDTTFLEFKEQVTGRNLDVLFEDVPVTDEDNTLEELIDGVVFNVKRSEPGTRVQVNITQDVDLTLTSIKTFVDKYNQVANFVHEQFKVDEKTKKAGKLSAESSLRQVLRSLQGTFTLPIAGSKFQTLAQIGIKTNSKTGALEMDDNKVKSSLAEDYDAVAKLFIRSASSEGIAGVMADKIKGFRDPSYGVLKSKMKSYDKIMSNIDEDIERKERALAAKEQALKRQFANLEGRLNDLKGQGDFLAQKFGAGGGK